MWSGATRFFAIIAVNSVSYQLGSYLTINIRRLQAIYAILRPKLGKYNVATDGVEHPNYSYYRINAPTY